MNYLVGAISSLITAIIMLVLNTWLNHRKEKRVKLNTLNEDVTNIKTRMDGIDSFSDTLIDLRARVKAREEVCENNHRPWNGIERRVG